MPLFWQDLFALAHGVNAGSIEYDDNAEYGMVYSQWLVNLDEEARVSNVSMHCLSAHDLIDCLSMRS